MNKFITKVAKLVLGLSLAAGVGVAVGSNAKASRVDAATGSWNLAQASYSSASSSAVVWSSDYLDMTLNQGSSQTAANNYLGGSNAHTRMYANQNLTFEVASGYQINSVTITCTGSSYTNFTASSNCSIAKSNATVTVTPSTKTADFVINCSGNRVTSVAYDYGTASADPITYTGVTIAQKSALTGTYKGDAYYECQATVSGTGNYSTAVTWSITNSTTYGSGTSIANKASIDTDGKITFLDNCTVYVWATAADGSTHNTNGFAVTASGLIDNPLDTCTKITNTANVSDRKVYVLSNDGTNFVSNSISNHQFSLVTSVSSAGFFVLEAVTGGYHLRFATESNGNWTFGNYVNWAANNDQKTYLNSTASATTTWSALANSTNGVYLKDQVSSNRHIGLGTNLAKAYTDISSNAPVYLWEAATLPVIDCALIELTGAPSSDMEIGDTATLGYSALDGSANEWIGDVVYSISNEKDPENNSTSGVVSLSATSGTSVTLTALKAGTARVSVQDAAENATADYVDVTVLATPERIDLPVGDYSVTISISGSGATIPESTSHEIKAKEGRTWYKDLVLNYTNVSNSYNNEYTMTKSTGVISTTNNSNAIITTVEVDYYQYENATMYVGSTPISSSAGTNSGNANSLMKVYTINAQNFALKNEDADHAQSFYSLKINLEVIDENEEFLSLVVSKSASWSTATNGTYKDGQSPSNSGLIATANFTTDGETISRSEDVTALVSNWAYTPSTLSTSDTSFGVVATWSGHTSASFTVTNITVQAVSGDIAAGRYFVISQSGNTLDRAAVTAKDCPQEDILSSASWTFSLVDDDTYTIHATIGGSEKYLTITNDSQGLRTNGTSTDYWTVTAVSGGYTLLHNSSERYLCDYNAAGVQWRTYKAANAAGYNTITLTEEKDVFANNFLSSFTAGCNADGGYTAADMDWTAASTQYATLSEANQGVFESAQYTKSGSGSGTVVTPASGVAQNIAETVARYDYIVGMHGTATFSDFMSRNPSPIGGAKVMLNNIIGENNNTIAIIVVISMVSVTAIGGYFFLKKRREQN